jgi:ubiquinone/menaquinone biosynthesis C-methylase UbiE
MPNKMLFYENFANEFDSVVNMYDTRRRLEVFFCELLTDDLEGKKLLDAGSGTGWFSAVAVKRKAVVTSLDVGPELLKQVAKKCKSTLVVGSILDLPFKNNSFDYIVSSEVIEHVPDPKKAITELFRVLKPGGTIVLSTPNAFWHWSLRIAHFLKLRPYQGLENWSGYVELQKDFQNAGFKVRKIRGIHAFPFVINRLNPILRYLDSNAPFLHPFMVNITIKATK